jgi:protein TonB
MKKLLPFALLCMMNIAPSAQTKAQAQSGNENQVFASVQQPPTFPGGMPAFVTYIQTNLKYPKEAKDKNVQGAVVVQFIVEKDGSLSAVKAVRSPSELLSKEAIRVISSSPKWKPGMQNKKPVRVQYYMPIGFKL